MRLLTPFAVKGLTLKNRVVMAPMATNMGDAGRPTPALLEHYGERAAGGVGLVIVEAVLVLDCPSLSRTRLGLWHDDLVAPLRELARTIAQAGAVPVVQLVDLTLRAGNRRPADLGEAEIGAIVEGFVRAAARAAAAEFAAVEIHAAHATTLADFLSRRANRRTDGYGGGEAGRARIVTEVIAGVRSVLGPDYPLFCRLNADEYTVNGNTLKHSVPIARLLLDAGVDVLDVSAGCRTEDGGAESYSQLRGRPAAWLPDGPNLYLAAEMKRATGAPVIAVGKLGEPAAAEGALAAGACDLVALGRPLLADPQWVRKVQAGREGALRRCRCCDRCMKLFRELKAVHCVTFAES